MFINVYASGLRSINIPKRRKLKDLNVYQIPIIIYGFLCINVYASWIRNLNIPNRWILKDFNVNQISVIYGFL